MDYETFLDTVCIGQGQSGRFMQKKPNERKEVFVQVLGLDKYERIFWCVPIITAVLLIVDDILKDIKNKNNIFLKIEGMIFFTQWILLSSMQIIILFLDLSIVSKMISLLCLIALNYVAYKRYMGKNEEEIERKE